jgi:hypothetical protein
MHVWLGYLASSCAWHGASPARKTPASPVSSAARPRCSAIKLDELAAKGVSEFAFVMQPLKLQGATGSTVAPAAIR